MLLTVITLHAGRSEPTPATTWRWGQRMDLRSKVVVIAAAVTPWRFTAERVSSRFPLMSSSVACHTQKRSWVHIIGIKPALQRCFFFYIKWSNISYLSTHAYWEYDWVHIYFHHATLLDSICLRQSWCTDTLPCLRIRTSKYIYMYMRPVRVHVHKWSVKGMKMSIMYPPSAPRFCKLSSESGRQQS